MIDKLRQHRWRAGFPGNYTGEILYGRNIDISTSPGRVILADKMLKSVDTADTNMSNLEVATKFLRSNADATDRHWAVCGNGVTGGRMFKTTDGATPIFTWAEETQGTGDTPPTTVLDIMAFETLNGEQQMLAVLPTDAALLNSPATANKWDINWGTTVAAPAIVLTTATLHPIARLQRLTAIGNGNVLQTIDKNSVVVNSRITIPYGYSIRNIYTSSDRFWIGCTNLIGTNAKIIEWDGFSLTYNNEYDIIGDIPVSGFIVGNVPYFITNYGYIYKYTGGSFVVDQQFPLAEETLPTLDVSTYGCTVNSTKVSILANATDEDVLSSRKFRAGIWEYNTVSKDLYHKHGIGATDTGSTTTLPDFGQSKIHTVGGITFAFTTNSNILFCGAKIYTTYIDNAGTGGSTSLFGLFRQVQNKARYQSTGINRGYLVTSILSISGVEAFIEGLWVKFKRFIDSGNRVVVKARVQDPKLLVTASLTGSESRMNVQAAGTWTSTTTFTAVVPTGVVVGDEVEVLNGNGATCLFHISTLSATPDSSATITVTVDEALPTLNTAGSRGALFRFDNWIKVGTISSTTVGNQKLPMPEKMHGEFLQLKVELRGHEVEIDEIIPVDRTKTSSDML